MLRRGLHYWTPVGALGVLVVLGLVAWVVQLRQGLGAAGYADRSFWSIYEADLVAFIGVSYGGALVSAILRLTGAKWRAPITRVAEATALFSLIVGMLFAVVHLGRPERIWEIVLFARMGSPIVWDFIAVVTYLAATCIFLYLPLIPDLAAVPGLLRWSPEGRRARLYRFLGRGWTGTPAQRRLLSRSIGVMAVLIIPVAVSVHSVLSWAFALTSRPGWHSTIFAPYFVVAAIYSGVALVIVVTAWFRRAYGLQAFLREEHFVRLGYILAALGAAYLYFTFSDLLTEGYTMDKASVSLIDALLVGRFAPSFWVFIVAGGVAPLVLVGMRRTRRIPGIVTAAALAVAGMWLKRMLIVVPAATEPLIGSSWGSYHMTWVSGAITLGAAAAIPLLLLLFFRFVPVLAMDEMQELAPAPAPALHAEAHAPMPVEGRTT
jgi:molybdopterin-containing oxidoreductase family membrane subunit